MKSADQAQNQFLVETSSDPATQFLMLCLRTRFIPDALTQARRISQDAEFPWDIVQQRIQKELLAPLIFLVVRGQDLVPPELEGWLHRVYLQQVMRNIHLLRELEQLLEGLTAAGIEAILLKGAVLTTSVYTNIASRYFGDLDLLVHWEDVNKALEVLYDLDYAPQGDVHLGTQDFLPYSNEWQLAKSGPINTHIDLHWHLFDWFQYSVPLDWFWQTAIPVNILDAPPAKMLGPEAHIIHLCGHLFQHHGETWADSLRLLNDIAELVNAYHEQLNWDLLLTKAQEYRLVIPVQQVLLRVWQGWQLTIPPDIIERLHAMRHSPEEARAVKGQIIFAEYLGARNAILKLGNTPTWRMRLQFIHRYILFPPTSYMRHNFQIRWPVLLPLYYPYRWYSGIVNVLKRSAP